MATWSLERLAVQEVLKQLRLDAQLTQSELANRLNKPQSYVSKYESGERRLDVVEIREICIEIGITLAKFSDLVEEAILKSGSDDELLR
ncbi:XRE family transcriptional regulator [Pseudomonas sp. REST10]|uniref:helix-turn-helix domain-containing protein n=1 Tax=Pseudomonas sp. REST10 TaxID=2512235 RepID=UPI00240D0517|nr:helix-turn-helix transcriptional regulator [Pseudomonas sp. REST10]WFC62633.1 XRE family transcriptional regulator [Pseudomonas sp. REST10]